MILFNHRLRYLFIAGLGIYSYINASFVETFRYYGLQGRWWILMIGFIMICLLDWEGSRLVQQAISKKSSQQQGFRALLILFITSLPIALFAALIVYYFFGSIILKNEIVQQNILLKLTILFSFRVNLFLQCVNAVLFFFAGYKQKQLEMEELKRISIQARLRAIQEQINPHFLFNNLNVLSTLVLQKHENANTFIEAFSSVYRYLLTRKDVELVKLREELEFIQPYIFLLTTRFGNGLIIELDIPDRYNERFIVPAALQLLVENAIKHNIVSVVQPLHIRMFVSEDGLSVSNNLQERGEKIPSTGLGLENINQRYRLLAGKEIKIERKADLFVVTVPLLQESVVTRSDPY
ncbi:sensor histidine kinase [Pollutibacter soli]|uniref:sensor histidine kinase n=1 Tax=Pollutibacter soli TaxID=3034157 RepID=UPI003013F1CB